MEKQHHRLDRRRPVALVARLERVRRNTLPAAAAVAAGLGIYTALLIWLLV